jgi:ubiquinone biosynthesis protein COQ9
LVSVFRASWYEDGQISENVQILMTQTDRIRDAILQQALPDIAFDGWVWDVAERAAVKCGYEKSMARAVFPGGLPDFVGHLSDWADRQMLESLSGVDPRDLRVRDRIRAGVLARIEALSPWREALRRAMIYWSVPTRGPRAGRLLWRSADRIWIWAGDDSKDYNHYSKRALLSGVIGATTLAWLHDESGEMRSTEAFLDRRIENVMELGRMIGRVRRSA